MNWFLLIFLSLCAIGFAAILIVNHYRLRKNVLVEQLLELAQHSDRTDSEKFEFLAEVVKLENMQVAWYEKSISTIGVVAFFSMLITVGLQTVNSARQSVEDDKLRTQIAELASQKNDTENIIREVSSAIVRLYTKTGKLDEKDSKILRHRLMQLENSQNMSNIEIVENYKIAMIVGDFQNAIRLLEDNIGLLDSTSYADQITLAEYYFFTGVEEQARNIVETLRNRSYSFTEMWQYKYVALSALLDPNFEDQSDNYFRQVAGIFRITLEEARSRLEADLNQYNNEKVIFRSDLKRELKKIK